MASHKNLPFSYLITALTLILLLANNPCATSQKQEQKVTLALYYETLCPYCSNFMVNYLKKLFETGLIDITNLKLVPYGNAKLKPNGTITCQHGEYECLLNTVEACAIDVWPNLDDHFPFIYCVEKLVYQQNYTQWETCFEKLDLDPAPVTNCYKSGRGQELELAYAAETNALQPPHKYVPWVVVDGEPLYDDYRNFLIYICKAYKGTTKPPACCELSIEFIQKLRAKLMNPFCKAEETSKLKLSGIISTMTSWMFQYKVAPSI